MVRRLLLGPPYLQVLLERDSSYAQRREPQLLTDLTSAVEAGDQDESSDWFSVGLDSEARQLAHEDFAPVKSQMEEQQEICHSRGVDDDGLNYADG